MMLYWSIYKKKQKLMSELQSIMGIKKSARLSDKTKSRKECIQSIIHVWLFLGVKLNKFNFFHNPFSSQTL